MNLDKINAERRRKGLPALTRQQAETAVSNHPASRDDGFDSMGFLIGLTTGIPIGPGGISGEAIIGAALHSAETPSYSDPTPSAPDNSINAGGVDSGGGGSTASYTPDPTPSAPDPIPSYTPDTSSPSIDTGGGGSF